MSKPTLHHSHSDVDKRLKRAAGHIKTIITMLDSKRPCLEIAQQLHAVEKAISSAKKVLIHDHLDHCLDHAAESRDSLDEFKKITKYL